MSERKMNCPKCETECDRESVHIGIGMIHGPWGCPFCGWSESSEYDLSEGQSPIRDNAIVDQWGGWRRIE